MKRLIARVSALLAGGIVASALMVPQSAAEPATTADAATHRLAATGATAYWTPERMRDAVQLDKIQLSRPAGFGDVFSGAPLKVDPTPIGAGPGDVTGESWTDGGAVTHTAGRVFFTFDGKDSSCSANAVTSDNRSTVITAGHCVKYHGSWHSNWVFVPGYHNGEEPFGEWPAESLHTTPQWKNGEDINYDIGAAVVRPVGGHRLTDVVGGQGIAFNQPRGQRTYAFGYPAAKPYDGSKLVYCAGTTFEDILFSNDQGLGCDMTGGASGGPWLTGFDPQTGTGVQNSVNSFSYLFLPNVLFGPPFGDAARELYQTAQSQ